ncbi:MAG TPA: hypothetical protein VEU96_20755 [Bryobacteraceae bacterium]|nr:hypothetical protein [Bryobacteraceae bacterium]
MWTVARGRFAWLLPSLLFVVMAVCFFVANRAAYHGYFTDDELDNLYITRYMSSGQFALALFSPQYYEANFRPAGHFYFHALGNTAGLDFAPYVAILQIVHLLNVALLWFVLRRLALPFWATAAGALFFAFHMAAFDIFWKPMYVFDLLCATFCLLSLLFWLDDRWILSLLSFWIAYRAKEMAVMLPLALGAADFLMGKRRWPRLIPFFAISLWFGLHGLGATRSPAGYQFHYDLASLWKAVLFYSSRLVLLPYTGLVLLPLLLLLPLVTPPLVRDRIVWWGTIIFAVLLLPMLLLSDKMSSAYLYAPLIGLSIVVARVAARQRTAVIVVFFALWIPWNYVNLRWLRRDALSQADDRRRYVGTLVELMRTQPDLRAFIYRDTPVFSDWGARSTLGWLHPDDPITLAREDSPQAAAVLKAPALAVLDWNAIEHRLETVVRKRDTPDVSYLEMGYRTPVWQLTAGWLPNDRFSKFRWTRPHAAVRLHRPADATQFELIAAVSDDYIGKVHHSHIEVAVNGRPVGSADFDHSGLQTVHWKLDQAPAGEAEITIDTSPPYPGQNPLGIAVVSCGFLPRDESR